MRKYACSDLHGRMDLYDKIKSFVQPEDIIYFLGDAIDRGPQPWLVAETIYNDPQFVYLKGNHEDMLVQALNDNKSKKIIEGIEVNSHEADIIWCDNGGSNTYYELRDRSENPGLWIDRLDKLPTIRVVQNTMGLKIILTHSGYTPPQIGDRLWNRSHFYDPWPIDSEFDNVIMVHGHTPVQLMEKYFPVKKSSTNYQLIYDYCDGHKINIDIGAVWTGAVALLDLDTLEEFILGVY